MTMVESDTTEPAVGGSQAAHRSGLRTRLRRLYRGETDYPFIGRRRVFYAVSGVVIVICILSMIFRGFNEGIEFKGGTQYNVPATGTSLTTQQVNDAFAKEKVSVESVQKVGDARNSQYIVRTGATTATDGKATETAVENDLKIQADSISQTTVSSSWGENISRKAVQALIVFLIVVSIYIAIRFQPRMAVAAIGALLHDLVLTAGVYSIVGFELTPSTVVGLLTILGFSLYDTVVIFDKVAENTRDLTAGSRMTFSEGTNLAVNQTLMRSINTSLISLLPVAGLLFIGAFILGVGTIKDLALVMFVGLATGAYSSLFLAAPFVVDLTERLPAYKNLTKRVEAKRITEAARQPAPTAPGARSGAPAPAPMPGARPQRVNPQRVNPRPSPAATDDGVEAGSASAPATRSTGTGGSRSAGAKPGARPGGGKPGANRSKSTRRGKR